MLTCLHCCEKPKGSICRYCHWFYRALQDLNSQQTRDIHTMLFRCWITVFDGGPTLKQYCVNGPCLLVRYRPEQVDMIGSYDDILTYGVKRVSLSRHDALTQCWINAAVVQCRGRWTSIEPPLAQ